MALGDASSGPRVGGFDKASAEHVELALVVTEEDLDSFASALEDTVSRAERMPRALVRFALGAARAGGKPRRRLTRV